MNDEPLFVQNAITKLELSVPCQAFAVFCHTLSIPSLSKYIDTTYFSSIIHIGGGFEMKDF